MPFFRPKPRISITVDISTLTQVAINESTNHIPSLKNTPPKDAISSNIPKEIFFCIVFPASQNQTRANEAKNQQQANAACFRGRLVPSEQNRRSFGLASFRYWQDLPTSRRSLRAR